MAEETSYVVTVSNIFDATSKEDAVLQMAEWLAENARAAGYRVAAEDDPTDTAFIDAERIY